MKRIESLDPLRGATTPGNDRPVPVTMIQPTVGALLMTLVGRAMLPVPHMATTRSRAVLLPTIAAHANPKYRLAIRVAAKPLPENNFSVNLHPLLRATFDNGCGSCQRNNYSEVVFLLA